MAMGPAAHADTPGAAEGIRENRMGRLIIETTPGALVQVEQTRHEFWFGAALSSRPFSDRMPPADAARYRDVFRANFNAAVPDMAMKWPSMERRRGEVNYAIVDAMVEWTEQNHLPLRGHNVFWGVHKYVPEWLKTMDDETLRQAMETRARSLGARYRGRVLEYDLNNEMVHGNYYAERLGPRITLDMAHWLLEEDPSARIFVNDYDILTGKRLADYVAQIGELLKMGVPLAGIGVQGHSHEETFDREALRHALDELAQFQLPIRVTEFNMPGQNSKFFNRRDLAPTSEEEEAQAREFSEYFRICFSHSAVSGILLWGFWENSNWIPASSLFRQDWSPTPTGLAYRDLVFKEWWTRWEGTADHHGRCELPAFFGTYRISTSSKHIDIELRKVDGTARVRLP